MSECEDVAKPPDDPVEKGVREAQNEHSVASQGDSEQLAEVLIKKRPQIIKELDVDVITFGLNTLLSVADSDILKTEKNGGEKSTKLIECIERKTGIGSYELFDTFLKLIAGTQPCLFTSLVGRSPTLSESDFCIEGFVSALKDDVQKKGHCTDSFLDEKVDLTKEHVQLKIRKISIQDSVTIESQSGLPPHTYQEYLEKVENEGHNASVCDSINPDREKHTVIQGRAGIGKTTTMQYFARQWSVSKWATGFRVLFLLQLRHLMTTDWSMTAVELLILCGLYQGEEGFDMTLFAAWMVHSAKRVLILIDGLDEISGFALRMKSAREISKMDERAHPVDLVINILRGNILPECSIISTSRPFVGLNELQNHSVQEILGLTQCGVREYLQKKHPNRAEHIMSVLSKAPLLMSLCSITVYCMIMSTLLSEGVVILDEDVQTYTRLTAFILVKYASRKLTKWPFVIEVNSYFSKLTKLAYKGIFESQREMPTLVFNEYDLVQSQLTTADLDAIEKVGILEIKEKEIGQRKTINAEFLHLSIQEMLAVVQLLSGPSTANITDVLLNMLASGQYNMTLYYLFGLTYDAKSPWIKDVLVASGYMGNKGNASGLEQFMNSLVMTKDNNPQSKLLLCQLVHECQNMDLAKSVDKHIAPDGKLLMQQTLMTVLDLNAVLFVCQHIQSLTQVHFCHVNADDTFIKVLSSTLLEEHASTLQILDLSHNNFGADGARALAECISQNRSIHTLNLSHNDLGVDGAKAIAEILKSTEDLNTLDMSFCNIQAGGMKAVSAALQGTSNLTKLVLGSNNLSVEGAEAVAPMLLRSGSIIDIDLGGNNMGCNGTKWISTALLVNRSIKALHLPNNDIGYEGAQCIEEMLKHNKNVLWLDLSYNPIGEGGAKALSNQLHSLHVLGLKQANIGVGGANEIALALRMENNLSELSLPNNNIGTTGATSLASMLADNDKLERLDISCNNIGFAGTKALVDALDHNDTLKTLLVTGVDTGYDGLKALTELRERKSTQIDVIFV